MTPASTAGSVDGVKDFTLEKRMDIDELFPEQQAAVEGLLKAVEDRVPTSAMVGYAGTGKTLTTARLVMSLRENGLQVAVTAPTHKAAAQLRMRLGDGVTTLHAALGLREYVDPTSGRVSYKPGYRQAGYDDGLESADVLVVDEASMIGEEILQYSKDAMEGRTIVWVGDDAQLPPVGEKTSKALSESDVTMTLQEVRRHGGDVLREATRIREALEAGTRPGAPRSGDGVRIYGLGEGWLDEALRAFQEGEDVRVMGWTNRMVRRASDSIHASLWGRDAAPWLPGQRVVALDQVYSPGVDTGSISDVFILLRRSEEATIESAEPSDEDGVSSWRIVLRLGGDWVAEIRVVANDGLEEYQERVTMLKRTALDIPADDRGARSRAWAAFYAYGRSFAKIERTYASTVHKAQGSTFRHAFVNLRDIGRNRNLAEMTRCYYTAVTRAAESLHVLV